MADSSDHGEEPDGFRMTQLWEERAHREEEEEEEKQKKSQQDRVHNLEIDDGAYLHIPQQVNFTACPTKKLRVHFTYSEDGQKWMPMNVFVFALEARASRIVCDHETKAIAVTVDQCRKKPYSLQCTVFAVSDDYDPAGKEDSRVVYTLKIKPVKDLPSADGGHGFDTHGLELPVFAWA